MKYLLSWIREYAPVEADHKALAGVLMDLGMNLEAAEVLAGRKTMNLWPTGNSWFLSALTAERKSPSGACGWA